MQLPYVSSPERALLAAQISSAGLMTALIWSRPIRPRVTSALLVMGIWIAALSVPEVDFLATSQIPHPSYMDRVDWLLGVSSLLFILAMVLHRRHALTITAVVGAWLLDQIGRYVTGSDWERGVLATVFAGLLFGLASYPSSSAGARTDRGFSRVEFGVFTLGLAVATFVAVYVLDRYVASGDEWSYQYQADLFAHGKLYGPVPDCPTLHMTYWIYYWQGRSFSQYTPSWPLILAPFQRLGVYWLANPILFGILLVGVSRLSRRAASDGNGTAASIEARAAGIIAPVVLAMSGAMLLNAGSLFSHNLVCALFAWCAELLFALTSRGTTHDGEWAKGLLLGVLAALLLGARPVDAAAILPPMAIYGVYALAKGQLGRRAVFACLAGLALVSAIVLIILRVQLGAWFRSGYSLTATFQPWAAVAFSWPKPDEWKFGVPLATGAYCFWPCSAAAAAVGIVWAYRKKPVIPLVLGGAALGILAIYSGVNLIRHVDWGYGPRYVLPILVPIAVFMGVAVAPLFARIDLKGGIFRGRYLETIAASSRVALAVGMIIYGTWVIGSLLYPVAMTEIRLNSAPFKAIRSAGLHNAVVVFGRTAEDAADLTQNLASNTKPDVVYLMERGPAEMACGRRLYPDRKWYRVSGIEQVQITPID